MNPFARGEARYTTEIDVPAAAFWDVLTDWASMEWLPEEPSERPVPVRACVLAPGQQPGDVPLTRIITLEEPGQPASQLRETLIYKDPEAGYLRYTVEGVGPAGMRNYLAQEWLDVLGRERTRVTLLGRFDVTAGPAEPLQEFLRNFYALMIRRMAEVAKRRAQHNTVNG